MSAPHIQPLHLLAVLDAARPHLVPHDTVVAEYRLRDPRVAGVHSRGEIEAVLDDLERQGHVRSVANPDAPGGCRWTITDAGLARLRESGS